MISGTWAHGLVILLSMLSDKILLAGEFQCNHSASEPVAPSDPVSSASLSLILKESRYLLPVYQRLKGE